MHYGIIAFVSNKEITSDILSTDQISQLLKKIPMYEEPEAQAKFYKELIDFNIRSKSIRPKSIRPTSIRPPSTKDYNFDNNINVFVTGEGNNTRVSELSNSTRGSTTS